MFKQRYLLENLIFEDLEVLLVEPIDRTSVLVKNRDGKLYKFDVDA